jgi:hypothetical protein
LCTGAKPGQLPAVAVAGIRVVTDPGVPDIGQSIPHFGIDGQELADPASVVDPSLEIELLMPGPVGPPAVIAHSEKAFAWLSH